jgi:SOS response regulatory protein OraA/RecX
MARTSGQLAEGLRKREFPEPVIEQCLARCEELLLTDDGLYVELVIEDRLSRGYGPRRVQTALRDAHVAPSDVVDAVGSISARAISDSLQVAMSGRYRGPLTRAEQTKARGYLMRRGFAMDVIAGALADLGHAEEERSAYEPHAVDLPRLRREVLRRYPQCSQPRSKDQQRALGWLARRGVRGGQAWQCLADD